MQNLLGQCTAVIDGKQTDIVTLDCILPIFANLVFWALVFAGAVAIFFIIFSGIKFLTSQGDPKQVEGARKTLTFAVAGLVIILSSFAIITFIAQTTGVACIKEFGFTNCRRAGPIQCQPPRPNCGPRRDARCDQRTGTWFCPIGGT